MIGGFEYYGRGSTPSAYEAQQIREKKQLLIKPIIEALRILVVTPTFLSGQSGSLYGAGMLDHYVVAFQARTDGKTEGEQKDGISFTGCQEFNNKGQLVGGDGYFRLTDYSSEEPASYEIPIGLAAINTTFDTSEDALYPKTGLDQQKREVVETHQLRNYSVARLEQMAGAAQAFIDYAQPHETPVATP